MKALVTGGTGLIGSHLAERLLRAGDRVRVLARGQSDISHLKTLGVEIVRGDLHDGAGLARALRGVEVVHHNAARVSDWGPWREFAKPAIEGTASLLQAAVRADVGRFVHMSSAGVYGLRRIWGRRVDELTPIQRPPLSDPYSRSKIASEAVVSRHRARGDIGVTILRPTFVYGPRDRAIFPRLARLLSQGRLIVAGRGDNRLHLIYAGDVAEAACRAGRSTTAAGHIYLLDGRGEIGQREFLLAVATTVGAPPPRRSLPVSLLWVRAVAGEGLYRLLRRPDPPRCTRYLVAFCGGEAHFDTSRAERELGFRPRVSICEGLARTREWWEAQEGI
ncbi:MAG: NAD-dependent epimerase/dehydratase family protein [Myxococcota bacterium]